MNQFESLPPLNPTRVFEVVARLGSVTRAAEELVVTPAAVSKQVATLERSLGVRLFRRSGAGIELTEDGSFFAREAGPALAAIAAAARSLQHGRAHGETRLLLSSPATFAVRWLIPRLATFHRLHGNVRVSLRTSSEPVDFGLRSVEAAVELGTGPRSGVDALRLIPNLLVPVAAPGYLPSDRIDGPESLAGKTLLHSLARIDDWAIWLAAAGDTSTDPELGMRYETSLLAYQAALEGHGVALAQRALVSDDIGSGRLVLLSDVVVDRGAWTYYFVWPRTRTPSAALGVFKRWLEAESAMAPNHQVN